MAKSPRQPAKDYRLPIGTREVRPAHDQPSGETELFPSSRALEIIRDLLSSNTDLDGRRARQFIADFGAKGPTPSQTAEEKPPKIDYTAEEVKAMVKEHGDVADHARRFMDSGSEPWPACSSSDRRSSMPGLPSGSSEPTHTDRLGLPISTAIATHIDYVMAQTEDTKPSQANKVLRLWPSHFSGYCAFKTTMSDADLQAFQGASTKDLEKLVAKDPAKKRSIEASRAHAQLGQNSIKCGALMDTMAHVVDEATSQATSHIDAAITALGRHRYLGEREQDEIAVTLEAARDSTQTAAMVNGSMAFAGFAAADLGARAVHTALRALRVEHIKCLLDTEKVDTLSQLTRDLPVESHSLFGDHLTTRIVELARSARDYSAFAGLMPDLGLPKPRSIKSRLQGSHPFRAKRLRGASSKPRRHQAKGGQKTDFKPKYQPPRQRGGGTDHGGGQGEYRPPNRNRNRGGQTNPGGKPGGQQKRPNQKPKGGRKK